MMLREPLGAELAKACCAALYQSEAARFLLGDSFHPGGERLTRLLAECLQLGPEDRVLDVGCGRGVSALVLARERGCSVVGMDYGKQNVEEARRAAADAGLADRVAFYSGDAEAVPFGDGAFDAVICECVVSTFTDKTIPLQEMRRVLKPQGRLGMTDVTLNHSLPDELRGVAGHVACIGGAFPQEEYIRLLQGLSFRNAAAEDHSWAVAAMVKELQRKVLLACMASTAGALNVPGADLASAQRLLESASAQVAQGNLGYTLIVAVVP